VPPIFYWHLDIESHFDEPTTNSNSPESDDNAYDKSSTAKEVDIAYSMPPAMNDHSHKAPNHSRPLLYVPNSLWTRLFAATVVTETVLTVAIER